MRHFDVVGSAKRCKLLFVSSFDDYCHTLLRLADGQLRGIQAVVFDGHPVEVDVKSGRKLANGHAHASGSEVVGFFDEGGYLFAAEKPLELALFRGVALLDFTAAGFQ